MIQVTIFSGHDGRLRFGKMVYLTVFGGCDLARPTIARQLVAQREAERQGRAPMPKPFFLTIFGGVDIKSPTLAEEFIDLRELLGTEVLTMPDWERSIAGMSRAESSIASFTLFGGLDECELPSENQEIDALALHRHLGNVSEAAAEVLQYGIGQRDAERYAIVRRAILAET